MYEYFILDIVRLYVFHQVNAQLERHAAVIHSHEHYTQEKSFSLTIFSLIFIMRLTRKLSSMNSIVSTCNAVLILDAE